MLCSAVKMIVLRYRGNGFAGLREIGDQANDGFVRVLVLGLFITLIILGSVYYLGQSPPGHGLYWDESEEGQLRLKETITHFDFFTLKLPPDLDSIANNLDIPSKRILVWGRDMFYREAFPPNDVNPTHQNAVLLHGMSFKSLTWENLTTIGLLAAMGHRVVAFDLPGYGETAGKEIDLDKRGDFLNEALIALKLTDPVVVSPSMSGTYSLPYLFKYPGKMSGFVPVAPVTTENYSMEEYQTVKTPTLIIYGELDHKLGENSTKNLRNIPNSQVQMLEGANHPAYLDRPTPFHTLLYNFFLILQTK